MSPLLSLLVFPYRSVELAFFTLDLYPKIISAREMQKEKNKSLPDKGICEFGNTQQEKEANH